jgi:hypothetical protein
MKKWTPEKISYVAAQYAANHSAKSISMELGCSESAIWYVLRDKNKDTVQPEDIFSYKDIQMITGIPIQTVASLIECKKLRGNGTVERKDLISFVLRYPGECEKGSPIQLIYLLGGDKCSPNLM